MVTVVLTSPHEEELSKRLNWIGEGATGLFFGKPDFEKLKQNRDEKKLIRFLKSKDDKIREQAACSLGDIRAQSSTAEVVKLLVDENSNVRSAAMQYLTMMGWRPTTSEERMAWFFARNRPHEATSLQDADIPMLIQLLSSAKLESTRILAAQALGYRYDDHAIAALISVLAVGHLEPWKRLVEAAGQALVNIGNAAVPKLQEVADADVEMLTQKLFEPERKAQLSGQHMPMPIFVPRPTHRVMLKPAQHVKQKATDILREIQTSARNISSYHR